MIGTFPFMFIPGFFVPLAVVLHVLAIRSITSHASPAACHFRRKWKTGCASR